MPQWDSDDGTFELTLPKDRLSEIMGESDEGILYSKNVGVYRRINTGNPDDWDRD